jgi:hypothetical protein
VFAKSERSIRDPIRTLLLSATIALLFAFRSNRITGNTTVIALAVGKGRRPRRLPFFVVDRDRLKKQREPPCGVGLCLAYWVAQVCNADAWDYRRVAKDGWRAAEVVEESNSGAKKNRRDVDADFVEEASIQ